MRLLIGLLTLALLPAASVAADLPVFQVPKTWEKVDAGRAAPMGLLTARDGYAVWVESGHVPGTENLRAWLYTSTVYRHKLGDKAPEQLVQRGSSNTLVALLGPNGMVATGWFANCEQIHLPGHKPIALPKGAYYGPHAFTAGGLLCGATYASAKEYQNAVVFFPINRDKGAIGEMQVLRSWPREPAPDKFVPELSHGRVFLKGNYLVYTGRATDPPRRNDYTSDNVTEVWDVRAGKVVWRESGALQGADDTHAYWFVDTNIVVRRALDGKTKAEQLKLPGTLQQIDVQPPKMFALIERDKEWVLTHFDLTTGGNVEFDLRVPHTGHQFHWISGGGATQSVRIDIDGAQLPFSLDAATGEAKTVWAGTAYKIPVAKRVPAGKPKWEPLAEMK